MEHRFMEHINEQQASNKNFEIVCAIIRDILSKEFLPEIIKPEHSLTYLGFNSIEYINLFLHLENRLDLDIETIADEINLSEIQTVQDLVNLVSDLKSR